MTAPITGRWPVPDRSSRDVPHAPGRARVALDAPPLVVHAQVPDSDPRPPSGGLPKCAAHQRRTSAMSLVTRSLGLCLVALVLSGALALHGWPPAAVAQAQKIRFGVGPLQPTPTETKKGYEAFLA